MKPKTTPITPPHQPLAILSMGMVTAMGDLEATCAAMRVRFNNHKETDFRDASHQPIIGSRAAVDPSLQGDARLVEMLVSALTQTTIRPTLEDCAGIPLGLCTPEPSRIGRPTDDRVLLRRLQDRLGVRFQAKDSDPMPYGHMGGIMALKAAQTMLYERGYHRVLVLAADSLINGDGLADLDAKGRLLTPSNSHGLIPGEAAVAMWLGKPSTDIKQPIVEGVAVGGIPIPAAPKRPPPPTGRELAATIHAACSDARCNPADISLRMADCNGLDARFAESAQAEALAFRNYGEAMPAVWQPAECLGDVGTASTLAALAWACHANRKQYLPGNRVLIHASNDIAQQGFAVRGAAILRF